jgi:hypothetical protein
MKRLLPLLVVFVLAGCYVRHTAVEDGSAKIAGSKKMVAVAYHTGPATITAELKDDEHDLRQLRPVPDSAVLISDSGTHDVLSYDPLSVHYNGSSKYEERAELRELCDAQPAHDSGWTSPGLTGDGAERGYAFCILRGGGERRGNRRDLMRRGSVFRALRCESRRVMRSRKPI